MPVPESVLSWLYSVLHEYHDPQRTYSDLAQTLAQHPSLAPRTEVYTFESGASALLVTLAGTVPVDWRGTTYRFPVKLCIPHHFPQQAPMVYVVPAKDMVVRPGQHVGVDGRVYHPYLRDWPSMWERAGTPEFLHLLQQVFAKEPPVISRAQQQQFQRPMGQQSASQAPSLPPLSPKQNGATSAGASQMPDSNVTSPPPLPPKPGSTNAEASSSRNISSHGPPLPPLPHEASQHHQPAPPPPPPQGYRSHSQPLGGSPLGYQSGRSPGPSNLPATPYQYQQQQQQYRTNPDKSPVSPISPTSSHPPSHSSQHLHSQNFTPQPWQPSSLSQQAPPNFRHQNQYPPQQQPQQPQKKQPAPDLLSDPFENALPAGMPPPEAPPIPPNPEKEHLLSALSTSLIHQTHQKVNQNISALAPLQAQQNAMSAAQSRLASEIRQLESLEQALSSNETILRRSIQECDRVISTAKEKKLPSVDEVLIAPTMVANQLWTLCAEEAAIREAMYVLQRGVDKGRIGGDVFVRQMRGLGRERFFKMVLARKCARGMGLDVGGR